MKALRDKLENSSFFKRFYRTLFYFEQGKGQINRFYNEIPQFIIILGGLKYLFGISFSPVTYIFIGIGLMTGFTLFGYFMVNTGLYGVDRKAQVAKDPVQNEIYTAAIKINGGERK